MKKKNQITGDFLNKLLGLGAKHALYRKDGTWYHNLKNFPGILFDKNGYIIFQTEKQYLEHPSLRKKQDLNIKDGIKSLKGYTTFSRLQHLYINENLSEIRGNKEKAIRIKREIEVILRNQYLVDQLKNLYNNTCQICRKKISIGYNSFYSEVHHIFPLGKPHNGPDEIENMICVCPNCHILLDYNALLLDLTKIELKHTILEEYILYHNNLFFQNK